MRDVRRGRERGMSDAAEFRGFVIPDEANRNPPDCERQIVALTLHRRLVPTIRVQRVVCLSP